MPQTYVVHLGNSEELTEVAEDSVARRVLREHIRESLGVRSEDLLFAIINSMFYVPKSYFQTLYSLANYFLRSMSILYVLILLSLVYILKSRCLTRKRTRLISSSILSESATHPTSEVKSAQNARCSSGK
jgi:hypothetical protein